MLSGVQPYAKAKEEQSLAQYREILDGGSDWDVANMSEKRLYNLTLMTVSINLGHNTSLLSFFAHFF